MYFIFTVIGDTYIIPVSCFPAHINISQLSGRLVVLVITDTQSIYSIALTHFVYTILYFLNHACVDVATELLLAVVQSALFRYTSFVLPVCARTKLSVVVDQL